MKQLTKAEEQIMHIIWTNGPQFLRDIMEAMPTPRPHQNTVSTILKILVEKNFIVVNVFGRQHQYSANVSKEEYSRKTMKQMVKGYFEGSFANVVSFMVKEKNISIEELEALLHQVKKQKNKK